MNERIKELRRQVFADTDEIIAAGARDNNAKILLDIMAEHGNKQLADLFFEKFAELVVQECCDVLYDNELGGYQVNYVLKEHFGIEK